MTMSATTELPVVVLVETQLGENIGMCARAMLNCGLGEMRLVRPRDGWPSESARATAADADSVLEKAKVFESIDEALADCERVFAATARQRNLRVPGLDLAEAVTDMVAVSPPPKTAVLFGPEASGLDNETLSRADRLIHFPTNPKFPSLNLAQAVLLFGWEWRQSSLIAAPSKNESASLAKREDTEGFLRRLEQALEESEFFPAPEQRPHTVRVLRAILTRSQLSEDEVKMLHGVLTALHK